MKIFKFLRRQSIVYSFMNTACFFAFTIVIVHGPVRAQSLLVSGLTTEYLTNPKGLEDSSPRFSWTLRSSERGATQSAYQIIVSTNQVEVRDGNGEVWDTGKVDSEQSINITYKGKALKSGKKYYWSVRVWDSAGQVSPWSVIHTFQMGLLNEQEWQAKWISHPDTAVSAPLLRTEFVAEKKVKSALAYITGVGYYELYLNGKKTGDHVLDPGVTDHRRGVLYETFDVTNQLKDGENAIGLFLGDGPFRLVDDGRYSWRYHSFGAPRGFVQLHITYRDGTQETVVSDDTWKASESPITYTNMFGGEDYDARLEQKGWASAGFDDSQWKPVVIITDYNVTLSSQLMPPVRVTQTIEPQRETKPEEGVYLFDLEQNIVGWWRISAKGEPGVQITVRGAETLNDSLFPDPLNPGDLLSTKHDYHSNVWTTYTLKGDNEMEVYEPRFFYTGFRYIEVRVDNPNQLEYLDVDGRVVHSDLKRNGLFTSSDSLLNKIYQAARWSQRGNLHSVPTDCPHREKGAYNGDGQVIAETSIHDFHMQPFYKKWLNDMRDAQEENGRIPNTSPTVIGGGGGGIPWGSAYIQIPWWMYQYYEDVDILKEHYTTMKFYLEYLKNLAKNDSNPEEFYIINEFGSYWTSLGEWEAPYERNDPNQPVVSTYYWYLNSKTLAEIAGVLEESDDQQQYTALADSIKQASITKFFNPATNLYGWDEPYQTYLLFALAEELFPEGHKEKVLHKLIDDIMIAREGHHATGILGMKHLFPVLVEAGREDVIHSVVTKTTFPSWGYWIENGMTTLGERWNGSASHNHQMFGSVNEYFYKYLAGIRAPTDRVTSPGYKEILIKPYVSEVLTHAGASLDTIRGKIVSRWRKEGDRFALRVSLPVNTSGRVSIPTLGNEHIIITEGGNKLWEQEKFIEGVEGIGGGAREYNYITFHLTSGDYNFELSVSN